MVCSPVATEIGRVHCWISTERSRQKEVLDGESGMFFYVKTPNNNNKEHVTAKKAANSKTPGSFACLRLRVPP